MATLLAIRTALNGEMGVVSDAETSPWTPAVRNQAISDGYADLWRADVWKDAKQDFSTVSDQWIYPLTTIRALFRVELLDSSSRVVDRPKGFLEPDGLGANSFQLALTMPLSGGYTLRVRGYGPYKSVFANDADVDDLPAEHGRVPRLKAKAILFTQQLATFARYGSKQMLPPQMHVDIAELNALVQSAEADYARAAKALSGLRPRSGQTRHF